ncbi:MAG: proline--tRNA ligase [Oscillospiraceae bacterium]|nr:proline--tRNA ligase [Oscillospiraceae bacterium]
MANDKNQVRQITNMEEDFTQWYTDVCIKAELVDYTSVKGFFVLRPYGYALWENIMGQLDREFKRLGHENVAMPMLIPESLLQKEADHVEGFAPECAWITYGGSEKLEERLCVRPTSETLFCDHWHRVVHSWRDLPKLYNQWCSVLRWEKTTRPFLRHREFYWQEGHTIHASEAEAIEETERMLEVYADICENYLAMPVVRGVKTDKEKFAGAERTYTIECMMHDRKALQSGTSHYFGNGFSKAFDVEFTNKNNEKEYPYQTSWGMSTRIIGGMIMTHGDDRGLVLPPRIAPTQVMVIPIAMHKGGVRERAEELVSALAAAGIRAKADYSENNPGWKFAEYEMKGIPLRIEIGPKDIEKGECVAVRRDNGEKIAVSIADAPARIAELLEVVQKGLYDKALRNLEEHTYTASTALEVSDIMADKGGFVKTMWCGDKECEVEMKNIAGVTSRCLPFKQEKLGEKCAVCGKAAHKMVVWGVAY